MDVTTQNYDAYGIVRVILEPEQIIKNKISLGGVFFASPRIPNIVANVAERFVKARAHAFAPFREACEAIHRAHNPGPYGNCEIIEWRGAVREHDCAHHEDRFHPLLVGLYPVL